MPLKLNVGLSRKLGLPQYSSVGALCHLEVELPASLLDEDLEALHRHVRGAYTACRQAVHDELARYQDPAGGNGSQGNGSQGNGSAGCTPPPDRTAAAAQTEAADRAAVPPQAGGDGNATGAHGNGCNGDGVQGQNANGNTVPGATQRQLDYLCQLARQVHGLGTRRLDALSAQLLGKPIAALTSRDASQLIASLQSLRDGEIALEDIFDGGAP